MDFTRDKHKNIKLLLPSQFHDIDQYLEHISVAAQLDADIIQLDQGSIHLIEQVFMFDDVGIIHFGSNKAIFERYSLPLGYTLFGLTPPQGSVQVSWCGISPSPDSIGITHSGREYSGYNPAGYHMVNLIIPQNWLLEQGIVDERIWKNSGTPENAVFPLPNQQAIRFRDLLYNFVTNKSILELLEQDKEMASLFREWILEEFLLLITACFKINRKKMIIPSQSRYNVFQASVKLIDQQLTKPLSISNLAAQQCTSTRILQYAFQKNIGLTPLQYVLHRKLHAARAKLQQRFPYTQANVSYVAMLYNMTHLGRFSLKYKNLFGELPSTTLKQINSEIVTKSLNQRSKRK